VTFPLLALSAVLISAVTIAGALVSRRYAFFGLLGSALLLALHGRLFINYLADDAYIYFRYAQNWADGHGPIWNVGEDPVEGYTGILWLLPLTAAGKLGLDVPEAARYLGFALAVGCLAALYPLNAALPGGLERPLAPVIAGLGLAAASPFATWTWAGMELPLFILLLLISTWLHLREQQEPRFPWSGPSLALTVATRPEGIVLAAVTGLFKLPALLDPAARRARVLQLALWTGSFVVLYGGYFLWRFRYYGHLLPNTFYAKVGTGSDFYDRGLRYLAENGIDFGLLLLVAGLVVYLLRALPLEPALYLAALVTVWLAWVPLSGGDTLVQGRFIIPVLPVLFLASAIGALSAGEALAGADRRVVALPASGFLLAVTLLAVLYPSSSPNLEINRRSQADRLAIGRWMEANLPAGTSIAVSAAGAVPYYSRLPTLDMLGLNDEHIAHADNSSFGSGFAGHEKFDTDYVLQRRPDVIVLGGVLEPAPRWTEGDFMQAFWILPNEQSLVRDPRTFLLYTPVPIEVGRETWLNLLVSREATDVFRAVGYEGRAAIGTTAEPGG